MAAQSENGVCVKPESDPKTEKRLKRLIRGLITATPIPECFNLVIKACNGMMPVPFSEASVVLQIQTDMMKSADNREHVTALFFDQIFNIKVLQKISTEEFSLSKLEVNDPLAKVLVSLMGYLHAIEKHKQALWKFKGTPCDESSLTAVLAEHLFSKLVPSGRYVIDDRYEKLPHQCPCVDCKANVMKGCTAIGSSITWHGYADVILNQTVALSFIKDVLGDDDDDEGNSGEPPEKRMCTDDQKSKITTCVEVKDNQPHSRTLFQLNVMSKIVAQAITNGFAQVNKNKSLGGWLIPTFGCTAENVCVFLYDPVNDVLLERCQLINLWQMNGDFNLNAIIKIWLYLNFTEFCAHDISKKYQLMKSSFHTCDEDVLKRYKGIQYQAAIGPSQANFESMIEPLMTSCVRATCVDQNPNKKSSS